MLFDEAGQAVDDQARATYSIPRIYCICPGGRAKKSQDEADQAKAEWLRQARLLTTQLDVGRYGDFRFSTWDDGRYDQAMANRTAVQNYTNDIIDDRTRRWLYLCGSYGVGKTHLAIAAVRQISAKRLWEPQVVVWPRHCSAVQESWSADKSESAPSEGRLWGIMRGAAVLLIDDIDKSDTTRWAIQKLYEVIDHRVIKRKVTIITANHSLEALRAIWLSSNQDHIRDTGLAILSRIAGELWGTVVFNGEDQRWKK